MKSTTRRYLDTCACIFEYQFDTENPDAGILNPKTVSRCSRHDSLQNPDEHMAEIVKEDLHRLSALNFLINNLPEEYKEEQIDAAGEKTIWFKDRPQFSYDEKGNLHININGLKTNSKELIQAIIDSDKSLNEIKVLID